MQISLIIAWERWAKEKNLSILVYSYNTYFTIVRVHTKFGCNTLERHYYADPYNAETVITRLVCGSHFLCSFFSPILKVLPFFHGTQQSNKSLAMTISSPINTFYFTKVVISILPFGYFRALKGFHIFQSSTWGPMKD